MKRVSRWLSRLGWRVRIHLALWLSLPWLLPRIAGAVDVAEMNITTVTELACI